MRYWIRLDDGRCVEISEHDADALSEFVAIAPANEVLTITLVGETEPHRIVESFQGPGLIPLAPVVIPLPRQDQN